MEQLTTYEARVLHEALSLQPGAPPGPWHDMAFISAGGLIAAGWTQDEHVLLVSHDGYSVSAPDGQRLARDREYSGLTPDHLSFALPGQVAPVPVFGVFGGDGSWVTADGWSIWIVHPLWPRPWLIMRAPCGPGAAGPFAGATRLNLRGLDQHDWLRAGFSPSGKHVLVVSASGCLVVSREAGGAR